MCKHCEPDERGNMQAFSEWNHYGFKLDRHVLERDFRDGKIKMRTRDFEGEDYQSGWLTEINFCPMCSRDLRGQ